MKEILFVRKNCLSFHLFTDFYKTMNLNQAFPPNPQEISSASIASASPPQPPIPKRRQSQRIYLKDRPQSIYQLQLSEIQVLNQQLQNYKSIQPAPPIPHSNRYPIRCRESQNQVHWHRAPPQGIATVVRAGEQFREQILAASELRNDEEKQKFNILRHIEALARERESLLSQIANQKAKSSLLEQELFLTKDNSAKLLIKIEAERNELFGEIKCLQISCGKLEGALQEANSQVAMIPLYEQRCLEKEGTVSLLTQQLNQARTQLGYFVEKSKYFENNHTVLNQNFNNLYMSNLNLSSDFKDLQRKYSLAEEQFKEMNKKVVILKEEKEKILNEFNLELKEIIIKKRGKFETSFSDPLKSEERLSLSLEQLRNIIKQQESLSINLQKQINNKENIILLEKSISECLKINLKDLEEDWKKKEEHWREAKSKEISNINRDFTAKILQLEAKNMRTKDEVTKVEQSLKVFQQQLRSFQKRQLELSSQLQASISQSQIKEETIKTLKSELEHAKNAENLNKYCMNDYQRKLNTSLTVQEQLSLSTRANLDQKLLKIRELQDKLTNSREELLRLQIRVHSLEQDLARSASLNEQLKSQLVSSFSAKEQLQQDFVNQAVQLGRIHEEASLKKKIIDKYCNMTDDMKEKIIFSHRQIEDLKQKCSKLLEQNEFLKAKNQKLQSAFKQVSASSLTKQRQNTFLQQKVISLENSLKQYSAKNFQLDSLIQATNQKIREKDRQALTAEMKLKQATKSLTMERDERIARLILQNGQKIEVITFEKAALENEFKKAFAQNKLSLDSMRNSLEILSSEKSQGELKIAQQRKIISQIEISLIQHAQNLAKTHQLLIQAKQKSKKQAGQHLKQKEYLTQTIKQLQSECEQHNKQKKIKTSLYAESQTKREEELKTNKRTLTEIAQILSNEKAKSQTLELEKSLLVKSLKQVQQTLSSQLQIELAQKSQTQKQLIAQKQEEIAFLSTQRNSLRNELDSLRLKFGEKESIISKFQTIIQRNNEVYKSQIQFLKKANLQLQADCSRYLHSSQGRNQILASTSRLEMKNSFLEQTLARTINEVESMQPLFGEVKQERDQLIKKYIFLSNEISSLKSQRSGLDTQFDAFTQYFSRISALYTQIGRHFYNISQLSQSTSFRVIHSYLPLQEQPQIK